MLVSEDPVRCDVPHEEGAWFDLLTLSHLALRKAQKKASLDNAEMASAFGAEFVKALGSDSTGDNAARMVKAQQYDESNYDTDLLLSSGVKGWSYEEEVTPETLARLDVATAVWAKQALIDLTKPPTEEEVKKS